MRICASRMKLLIEPSKAFMSKLSSSSIVDDILHQLSTPLKDDNLLKVMVKRFEDGLRDIVGGKPSSVQKSPTFIQDLRAEPVEGQFFGILFDMGVLHISGIELRQSVVIRTNVLSKRVPEVQRLLRGTERLHYISVQLQDFIKNFTNVSDTAAVWPVGVNYGYLIAQDVISLSNINVSSWPDEYNFTGKPVRMQNLGMEMTKAADKIGLKLEIKGFIHIPEALYLTSVWHYPNTIGALSLYNLRSTWCYLEKTINVKRISHIDDEIPEILLKISWRSYGVNGELDEFITDFDKEVDTASVNPGKETFFKLVGEMYTIRVLRLILIKLCEEKVIFQNNPENLDLLKMYIQEPGHVITSLGRDPKITIDKYLFKIFQIHNIDAEDLKTITQVINILSERAAILISMTILATSKVKGSTAQEEQFLIHGKHKEMMYLVKKSLERISTVSSYNKIFQLYHSVHGQVYGPALLALILTKKVYGSDENYEDV